jgi:hypothetical protein
VGGPPPIFGLGLSMLEAQYNLVWLPTVTNVPLLLALCTTPRAAVVSPPAARAPPPVRALTPAGAAAPATDGARYDVGQQVCSSSHVPRFVGNTPFLQNVRTRAVSKAIATA